MAHPVPDATLDGRLMEGTTNPEHSVLVGSLDSGLMEVVLSLEPLEQSVLDTLLVAQPMEGITETDPPERSAPASHLDYGQSNLESQARPMLNIAQDKITDTDPSERSALATHLEYGSDVGCCPGSSPYGGDAPLPVESSGLAMAPSSEPMEHLSGSRPLEHSVLDIKGGNDKLDIHDGPLFGFDHRRSCLEIMDVMPR